MPRSRCRWCLPPTVLGYYLLVLIGRASPLGKLWETIFGSPLVFTVESGGGRGAAAFVSIAGEIRARGARKRGPQVRTRGANAGRIGMEVVLARDAASRAAFDLRRVALAFARSLGDFGVTLMVAGNIPGRTQTVAVAIYDAVESGNGATARALVLVDLRHRAGHLDGRESRGNAGN